MAFRIDGECQLRPRSHEAACELVNAQAALFECYVDHDAAQADLHIRSRHSAQRRKHQLANNVAHGGHVAAVLKHSDELRACLDGVLLRTCNKRILQLIQQHILMLVLHIFQVSSLSYPTSSVSRLAGVTDGN